MLIPKPDFNIDADVTKLNLDELKRNSIQAIIFDLDSTIMEPRAGRLNSVIEDYLNCLSKEFKIAVLTNNKNIEYIKKVEENLAYPMISNAKKPNPHGFLQLQQYFDLPSTNILVVGDRPYTDIFGGYKANMKTCLVKPLQDEVAIVKFVRFLERLLLKN